ncbi:hypothetical protein ABH973_000868 [Bradyrhizobium ottawaense]
MGDLNLDLIPRVDETDEAKEDETAAAGHALRTIPNGYEPSASRDG